MEYIRVLSIAGSDCSGGAGIQADIKTISALGCYAAAAVTAVTVQNTTGVKACHPLSPDVVSAQIEAVLTDIRPQAIKIGMTANADIVRTIAEVLSHYPEIPVILDPVMVSTSGHALVDDKAVRAMITELFPLCTLITPNLPETQRLTSLPVNTPDDLHTAALRLLGTGCRAVLIKGGHRSDNRCADTLYTADNGTLKHFTYATPRITSPNTHGTGCTLSSAIAALLARNLPLPKAVEQAKSYIQQAIESGCDIRTGNGDGPLNHFFAPEKLIVR